MTNNVAEAAGLCALLDYLISEKFAADTEIIIQGDSMVVLNVVKGKKKQPKGFFVNQAMEARFKFLELIQRTPNVDLHWIPREMNSEADELAGVVIWE